MPVRRRLESAHGGNVKALGLFDDWDDDRWRSYEYPPRASAFGPRLVLEAVGRADLLGAGIRRVDPCCFHVDLGLSTSLPGHVLGTCCRHPGEVKVMRCCLPDHLVCLARDEHHVSYRALPGGA